MSTYIQKNIDSDLVSFADFNKEMSVGSGVDTSFLVSGVTLADSQTLGFITTSGVPNSNAWESNGVWTVELMPQIGNSKMRAQARCVRLDENGTILQSGLFTSNQVMNMGRTFTPVVPVWDENDESLDNRLAVEVLFTTLQVMEQSITVRVGTTDNEIITNILENKTLFSGSGLGLFIGAKDIHSTNLDLSIVGHQPTSSFSTVSVIKDTTLRSGPSINVRFNNDIIIKIGHSVVSHRCLFTFDISNIPSGSFIEEARISCPSVATIPGIQEFRTHPLIGSWVNAEATWNNRSSGVLWDTPGGDFVSGIFDSWLADSTFGEVKDDIIATNTIQNAVNSGLMVADVLLKEHIEASQLMELTSIESPVGGATLSVTFSTPEPNLTVFAKGHEVVNLNLNSFTLGSDTIPGGSQISLCINGVVAKTFDPANPPCPPLDPTASIQISDELIGIYQSRIDALINQLGKNILLEFEKIKVPCPNCFFDTMRDRSNGIFRPGGPRPFARGRRCPWCKGKGFEESDNNKCIKALLKWNPREAANYGLTLSDSRGIVRIKTFLTEFDDLKRAITVVANHDMASIAKLRVRLVKGPIPVGLREDRYCISFWELLDD